MAGDMQTKRAKEPYEITWLVRRLFRAMAQATNDRLIDFNITAADRAVLEFLYPDKKLAVPEIASRYRVSRQHVQTTANELIKKKLLTTTDNPQHKRSSLLLLTSRGKKLFAGMRNEEELILRDLFSGVNHSDAEITRRTLQALLEKLN